MHSDAQKGLTFPPYLDISKADIVLELVRRREFINRDEYYWFTRDTPGSALSTHMPMRIYVLMLLIHNSLLPFIDIGLSHA
jgi:hypothetical protein